MEETKSYWQARIVEVKRSLERNGMTVFVAETGDQAREKAISLIEEGAAVGLGGSRTVAEIGLLDALRRGGYRLFDQYDPALSKQASAEARKAGTHAEYFVTGSNAVTDDGKIVNIDGMGNRLAGLCFGPEKVILVIGRNKIVHDVDAAIRRVKNVAAPMNARRFKAATPCAKTAACSDCDSPERICNLTLIIEKQRQPGRMTVILVNEDLGF
jgi:L-lactate utilization protein LutB